MLVVERAEPSLVQLSVGCGGGANFLGLGQRPRRGQLARHGCRRPGDQIKEPAARARGNLGSFGVCPLPRTILLVGRADGSRHLSVARVFARVVSALERLGRHRPVHASERVHRTDRKGQAFLVRPDEVALHHFEVDSRLGR